MTGGSDALLEAARSAKDRAYAPYSKFRVGAALRSVDGRVFTGCNIENASYPVTICAERVALGAAVASGAQQFDRLAVVTDADTPTAPCGMCRQAFAEFGLGLEITSAGREGTLASWRLKELLPVHFELDNPGHPGGDRSDV